MNRSASFRIWLSIWSVTGYAVAGITAAAGAFVIAQSRQFQAGMLWPVISGVAGAVAVGLTSSAGKMFAGIADDIGSLSQFAHEQRQASRRAPGVKTP